MNENEKGLGASVPFVRPVPERGNPSEIRVSAEPLRNSAMPPSAGMRSRLKRYEEIGFISRDEIDELRAIKPGPDSAAAAKSMLEVIIGRESNLLPAWFLEVGAANSRAVCLIQTSGTNYRGERGAWSGTGFLISPNILLTNHHVLNSIRVALNAKVLFDFQANADGTDRETKSFAFDPTRLFITSPVGDNGLDFTFVWIEGQPSTQFGSVRLERNSFSIANEEFANIISHPSGKQKAVTLQENKIKWQDQLVVHYTSDTEPGSSGACVCNNEWKLIALHHASKASNDTEFPTLNEGIKVSAIATLLERMIASNENATQAREALSLFKGTDEALGYFGSLGRQAASSSEGFEAVIDSYNGEADDIDVAFWNVEWFATRYNEKVDAVARVIFNLNLDCWVLEESSPAATERLIEVLQTDFGLEFKMLACEPNATNNIQTCTVIWITATVDIEQQDWGYPIEDWLQTDSRDFDDLGLEAIDGKIFPRYPALFHVTTRNRPAGTKFDFYLVPLHLKAMAEGSKRRKMSSKIIAAAINKKMEQGADKDWVIGGDYNAELATGDFDALISANFLAASAEDAEAGSFTYLKNPHKSLIDHIFLSPNLATQFGSDDYFIIAAERENPSDFIQYISDHRPVLIRLSLSNVGGDGNELALTQKPNQSSLDEQKFALGFNKGNKKRNTRIT